MINSNHIPEVAVTESSLLKRVAVFLEDGEFDRADEYCERVLDMNVENGEAYLGKLLAKMELRDKNALYDLDEPFDGEPAYAKIMRFGDEQLKREIEKINASIQKKKEELQKALLLEAELTEAYKAFISLGENESAENCKKRIEELYDSRYNELYLAAKEKEQQINDSQYKNSTDALEKEDYDQYIKENQNKKFFDYSLLVAMGVALLGILAIIFSVISYISLAGVSFKTVMIVIFTRIVPGMPLTGISCILSFRICKKLIKKQKANLIEDISTAAQRAKEIGEKISSAENEAYTLKRELDERLDALKRLNAEYDIFAQESAGRNS